MSDSRYGILKIVDSAIFVFIIFFLLSLSNSIFVNQVGYYGALILILMKASLQKVNQFNRTGLEFALLWYILAEILSTIFSVEPSAASHNLLKRVLLIPIIYTIIASVNNYKDAKTFFKIYIGGTLVTVLVYLYFSFQFYLKNLYGITESGPSIFQYPITASEILSFTVIFLFAFFINEKTSIKNKILLFIGFSFSVVALFSTYKRTGWMGAAFGVLIILIMKKQWKLLLAGAGLIVIFLLTQKNVSEINIYSLETDSTALKLTKSISTEGKAYDVFELNNRLIVSDYNKGIEVFYNDSLTDQIKLPSAVIGFYPWKNNYYLAALADTRYILLENNSGILTQRGEIYSPGMTYAQAYGNGCFYLLDVDSGLTVFVAPNDLDKKFRANEFSKYTGVFVDTSFIIFSESQKGFEVFPLKNGLPLGSSIFKDSSKISFFDYSSSFAFTESDNGLNIYDFQNKSVKLIQNIPTVKNIFKIVENKRKYFIVSTIGDFYQLEQKSNLLFEVAKKINLGYTPKSISLGEKHLYITRVETKQSRLLGIFDPNHPSNANRFAFWIAGIKIFKDYPIFGVGDIDLQNLYRKYKRPFDKEIQGHLHNNFFHVLATLGLFGLLAVLYLFYKIIKIDLNIYRTIKDKPFISSYALGALAAFCGFIISGLTELNFWDHEITTLIWFTFGLNIALFQSFKQTSKIN
ncbi:MAG: O-antigen ligase family protein [Ignavibacteriales bacterium]|nr:O-antigen ligase family protein [Ignavibacteriales bacterium]